MHYRNIDVSALKQLYAIWTDKDKYIKETDSHDALDDIKESIKELKYYKEHWLEK
jgi:oligoribonuclease